MRCVPDTSASGTPPPSGCSGRPPDRVRVHWRLLRRDQVRPRGLLTARTVTPLTGALIRVERWASRGEGRVDYATHVPNLLRALLYRMNDVDATVINAAWGALDSLTK